MLRKIIVVSALLAVSPAVAQQQQQPADPAFLQRALTAMQAQRNQAQDVAVISEAKAAGLAEELAKVQTRIKELEAKSEKKE